MTPKTTKTIWCRLAQYGFYSTDTDTHLLLRADFFIIDVTFFCFKNMFITCSFCIPEGSKTDWGKVTTGHIMLSVMNKQAFCYWRLVLAWAVWCHDHDSVHFFLWSVNGSQIKTKCLKGVNHQKLSSVYKLCYSQWKQFFLFYPLHCLCLHYQ